MSRRPIALLLLLLLCLPLLSGAKNRSEERAWRVLDSTLADDEADPRDLLQRARDYLAEFPDGPNAVEAFRAAGQAAYALELWEPARKYLEGYLTQGGREDMDRVKLMLAVAVGHEDPASGQAQLGNLVRSGTEPKIVREAARELVAQSLFDGRWRAALEAQGDLLDRGYFEPDVDLPSSRKAIEAAKRERKSKGRSWGESGWARTEKLFDSPTTRGLVSALSLEDAGALVEGPDTENARKAWAARFPDHPLASWVPGAEEFAVAKEDVDPSVIGLLIPETGRYSAPGQLVRRGIDLALRTASEQGWPSVTLKVVDTAGDPANAVAGLRNLASRDKAIAVLGPLLTAEAEQVAPVTSELGLPTLMLVQKPGLETEHPYAFNAWMQPDSQVRALVDHAVNRMGLRNFAVAYPNKESAADLARLFWEELEDQGGHVVSVESYDAEQTDFRDTARRLNGVHYVAQPPGEGETQLPYMPGARKPQLAGGAHALTPGVDFEAVFVSDNYRRVSMLAPGFIFEEINLGGHIDRKPSVTLVGGSALNHPDLIERGGKYIDGAVLVDGFVLESADPAVVAFVAAYRAAYHADPTLLEASAYDATLFLCQLLAEGVTTRRELLRRLSLASPAITVTGARGFEPGGAMIHSMKTLQVRKGGFVQVWPESGGE